MLQFHKPKDLLWVLLFHQSIQFLLETLSIIYDSGPASKLGSGVVSRLLLELCVRGVLVRGSVHSVMLIRGPLCSVRCVLFCGPLYSATLMVSTFPDREMRLASVGCLVISGPRTAADGVIFFLLTKFEGGNVDS